MSCYDEVEPACFNGSLVTKWHFFDGCNLWVAITTRQILFSCTLITHFRCGLKNYKRKQWAHTCLGDFFQLATVQPMFRPSYSVTRAPTSMRQILPDYSWLSFPKQVTEDARWRPPPPTFFITYNIYRNCFKYKRKCFLLKIIYDA